MYISVDISVYLILLLANVNEYRISKQTVSLL